MTTAYLANEIMSLLLTLNKKLEVIKSSKEGMLEAKIGPNLSLLGQRVSQLVNAKEKFSKETKSAAPVNTRVMRKGNSLTPDMENVLVVWRDDKPVIHSNKPKPHPENKALILNVMRAERGEEPGEEKSEAGRD